MVVRLPLLAVLLCAAVGASAAVVSHVWKLGDDGAGLFAVVLTTGDEGITLRAGGTVSRFTPARLTKEEAASLGRALLEAAGQPEKVCAATWPGPESLNAKPPHKFYGGTPTLQCPSGYHHLSEGCEESK